MEQWIPLFEIFLRSPSPEGDAVLWLQSRSSSQPGITIGLLSLLFSPSLATHPPSPSSIIFLQTLPPVVQCRILSFLAIELRRFPFDRLRSLATHVLASDGTSSPPSSSATLGPTFWVRKAAHNLLDAISSPSTEEYSDQEGRKETEDEFYAVPQWLKDSGSATLHPFARVVFPSAALRISTRNCQKMDEQNETYLDIGNQEGTLHQRLELDFWPPSSSSVSPTPDRLNPQDQERALNLRAELLASESVSEVLCLAQEIRQLCLDSGDKKALAVLELIQPWETEDEMIAILLANLTGDNGAIFPRWPAYVLCSVALPKFLYLERSASRALISATLAFCKRHPSAAVEALFFPLAFRKEGINAAICDVLVRIIKECLHPAHVSAYCQMLLCRNEERKLLCLPCHHGSITDELVWTESLFMLFQQILNEGIYLTPDTAEQLVFVLDEMAEMLSMSLKFGNFMLSFVTKCSRASVTHKGLLEKAAAKTNTFVTKSVLSKLRGQ